MPVCDFCFESGEINWSHRQQAHVCWRCFQNESENMPTFQDRESRGQIIKEQDGIFRVTAFKLSTLQRGPCSGAEMITLTLEIEGTGARFEENLIDHEKTGWKIDTFLKSAGIVMDKGQSFRWADDDIRPVWVNPIGLRGWCHVGLEEQESNTVKNADGSKKRFTKNTIAIFYTDRPKLTRHTFSNPAPIGPLVDIPF